MPHKYAHPSAVIERVTACRVVLTGAYHLAVFALSQGIPVVALTSTAYYDDKFYGLAEMFGTGITVIHFDDPDLEAVLTGALTDAWDSAHEVREPLRARAAEQIAASTDTLYGLLDSVAAGHAAMTGRADT
jgi:polysaccharide pyruvyl transferase WcaK-like protein